MLAVGTAEAQKRRLPSRTEEVPDTESGRPAASAERPTFKGRLLIFGPPSLPVTPPPEHIKPAPPEAEQTAKPAPPPVVVVPQPKPEPAPPVVVAPPKPEPVPVVVAPQPKPEPAPPVVIAPQPKPAPVAVAPEPKPEPIPVVVVPPSPPPPPPIVIAPPPAPVVAAPPAPAPIAAPAVREPVVREPIVRPEPKPAPAPQQVALAVPSASAVPSPAAPLPIEIKLIESIFTCLAPGLPQDWRRAWVEITDQSAGKEKVAKFRYTNLRGDDEGEPLVPCNAHELTRRIVSLNDKLPPDRRAWSRALLVIESDGEYELSYEYPK
jgi:hypothetical protein